MKNVIGSLVAVAGLAVAANAGTSRLDIMVSKDGVNWSSSVTVNRNAGDSGQVYIAYLMSYVPSSDTDPVPDAFASLTFQPVFSNVRVGTDTLGAFRNQGNNTNGGAIDPRASYGSGTGDYGRIKPWAATGPSTSQSYQVHTHTASSGGAPAGNYYRIARNDITRWVGTFSNSTGTAAVNNFNGAGGVVVGQKQAPTTADPARVAGSTNLMVMVLCMTAGPVANGEVHAITATAPLEGMSRNSATGAREASWYANRTENSASIKGAVVVGDAEIIIIPAPGSLALLGLGGLVAGRRRR